MYHTHRPAIPKKKKHPSKIVEMLRPRSGTDTKKVCVKDERQEPSPFTSVPLRVGECPSIWSAPLTAAAVEEQVVVLMLDATGCGIAWRKTGWWQMRRARVVVRFTFFSPPQLGRPVPGHCSRPQKLLGRRPS